MSDTIDNKVVSMKFDNKQFEQNIAQTMASLQKLQDSLSKAGSGKGLSDLQRNADNFNLDKMSNGIEGISKKFVAMSTIAITALANITNRAVDAGIRIVKSLTLDPVLAGFQEYELKMGSIQTILANTSKAGTTLEDVTKSLDELNEYSDKTIYNFGAMTKNIGLFTNAGLGLEDSVAMIKGFSNEAAASGTNAEGAAAAAYQLSQALSAGTIRLMDWRSLQNVGMGNKNMQNGLIDLASAMGQFNKDTTSAEAAQKNFNGSLEKQWLSADVMANYLKIQAGELSDAQMKSLGLTEKQIVAFKKQAKISEEAATKVRTFTQLTSTIKESIASGWSETFNLIIGDFNEATTLWTSVNDTLGAMIKGFGDKRNQILKDWADLGGRTVLIEGLKNAFDALMRILRPIGEAFREVFSSNTWSPLYKLTVGFRDFTEKLKMGEPQMAAIKAIFKAFFSILKIGFQLFFGVAGVIKNFFSILTGSAGGVVELGGGIADLVNRFTEWLAVGNKINTFFAKLKRAQEGVLSPIIESIKQVLNAFKLLAQGNVQGFFSGLKLSVYALGPITDKVKEAVTGLAGAFESALEWGQNFLKNINAPSFQPIIDFIEGIKSKLKSLRENFSLKPSIDVGALDTGKMSMDNLADAGDRVKGVWERVIDALSNVKNKLAPVGDAIGDGLKEIWNKFAEWFKEADFQDLVALINTGFFIAFYMQLRKFLKSMNDLVDMWEVIADSFANFGKSLSGTLDAMSTSIKAGAILKIAIAIAILAAAIIALGMLDRKALEQGMAAVAAALTAVSLVVIALGKLDLTGGKTIAAIAASLILIAVAVRLFVSSIKSLGKLDAEEFAQGFEGLIYILGGVVALITALSLAGPQVAAVGGTILAISTAMLAMGGLVAILGQMGEDTLGKGLAAVGGMALIISYLIAVMAAAGSLGPVTATGGAAMILAAGALLIMAKVVRELSSIKIASLIASMVVMTAFVSMLGALMLAAALGNAFSLAGAGGILMIAIALKIMADAVEQLGKLSVANIAKGIGALIALNAVLVVMALTSGILSPLLLALGVALLTIGIAMLAIGAGMLMFSAGMTALATLGTAGFLVIATGLQTFLNMLPLMAQQFGYALVAFAEVIGEMAPQLVGALGKLALAFIAEIEKIRPQLRTLLENIIRDGLTTIRNLSPDWVKTGYQLLLDFLKGLEDNIGEIATTVGDLIVAFIDEVAAQNDRILNAGSNMIQEFMWGIARETLEIINTAAVVLLTFLGGIETAIRTYEADIIRAGAGIADAIIDGLIDGLTNNAMMDRLRGAAENIASRLPQWMRNVLGIASPSKVTAEIGKYVVEGFAVGLRDATAVSEVRQEFKNIADTFKKGFEDVNNEIQQAKDERERLLESDNYTYKELNAINRKIENLQAEKARLKKTRDNYNKNLDDERLRLVRLASAYEVVTKKLEAAQDKLQQLKDDKKSKYDELFGQYNTLPDIAKDTGLQGYIRDTKAQTDANEAYKASLDQLRKLGLDDASYKKLLAEGTDAQSLVNQLASGGRAAVGQFNQTNKALETSAKALATKASNELFDAGIKAAEGLVKGLQSQRGAINREMDAIAAYMVKQIKKGLGIKSPSREFMEIAKQVVLGLAKGLTANKSTAGAAVDDLGNETIDRMREIIDKIKKTAENDIDSRPVIAPVVDLTDWNKGVKAMNGSDMPVMTAAASSNYAKSIAALNRAKASSDEDTQAMLTRPIIFNQTNNSPEALSNAEIYRQTKTLVAQTKQSA